MGLKVMAIMNRIIMDLEKKHKITITILQQQLNNNNQFNKEPPSIKH